MISEDEEEAAEGEAEEVAPAGSKRKTRTPHSDVGKQPGSSLYCACHAKPAAGQRRPRLGVVNSYVHMLFLCLKFFLFSAQCFAWQAQHFCLSTTWLKYVMCLTLVAG